EEEMKRDLTTTAKIVGQNSNAALTFGDQKAAIENLTTLTARPTIAAGALYDRDGRLFARYGRTQDAKVPDETRQDGAEFVADGLEVFHPVELNGERIGTIFLRSDLSELHSRIKVQAITVGAVFLVSGLAALLLSSGLQRLVSGPLLDLSQT